MLCKCGADTLVIDTRSKGEQTLRRKRRCLGPKPHTFFTFEMPEAELPELSRRELGKAERAARDARIYLEILRGTQPWLLAAELGLSNEQIRRIVIAQRDIYGHLEPSS
jgi:hypothetical protein